MRPTRFLMTAALVPVLILTGCGKKAVDGEMIIVTEAEIVQMVDKAYDKTKAGQKTSDDIIATLEETGSGWGSVSENNGLFVFSDFVGPDGDVKIERLSLAGMRYKEEVPYFSKLSFENLTIDTNDDDQLTIKSLKMNLPSGKNLDSLMSAIEASGGDFEDPSEFPFEDLGKLVRDYSGGFYLQDLASTQEDISINLKFAGAAVDPTTSELSLMLTGFDFLDKSPLIDEPSTMSMAEFSVTGFKFDALADSTEAGLPGLIGFYLGFYNPFTPMISTASITDFRFAVDDGMEIRIPSYKVWRSRQSKSVDMVHTQVKDITAIANRDHMIEAGAYEDSLFDLLGTDDIKASYESRSRLDSKNDVFELEYADIRLIDSFDFRVTHQTTGLNKMFADLGDTIENYDLGQSNDLEAMAQAVGFAFIAASNDVSVDQLSFEYTDHSLIETVISRASENEGDSPAIIRQQAKSELMMMTLFAETEYQRELAKNFAEQAQALIDKGGRLKISMEPEEGLTIMSMMQMSQMMSFGSTEMLDEALKDLNFQISHSAK
ncbi:MAG: hypothetical protein HKN36_04635 [Hellea sp.]|nr:hypothetical protein [Hellea sp.]